MNTHPWNALNAILAGVIMPALFAAGTARAEHMGMLHVIDGISNTTVTLTAREGHISTGDGNSIYIWGLAAGGGQVQYPAPTFTVMQGAAMNITLANELTVPVSLVFPGQVGVTASGGTQGAITREAAPGTGTVTYAFTAREPGTYIYHSGTRPDLQIEMGIVGAFIVRPTNTMMGMTQAYGHTNTEYDTEFLFLLTEMDENIHDLVEQNRMDEIDMAKYWPVYWFMNGRTGPDTMIDANVPWLPTQPYNCVPMFNPGQRVLMRVIGGGRDPHPLHHHGNNSLIIARNGRMLQSAPGAGADIGQSVFTIPVMPGETYDSLYWWTGEKLGWDAYGHMSTNDPLAPFEYAPDHGKPFPVSLPTDQQLTFGQHFGGSPFLGTPGTLPPGDGGFNPNNAFMFMWHSHNEKEICNNDIFPGGMLTMAMVEAYTMTNMPPMVAP